MQDVHQPMPTTAAYEVSFASHLPAALPDWFMPLVPVAASSTSGASTASATISTPSDSSTVSPNATSNGTTSSTVLLSSVSGSYSSEKQRQAIAAALGLQPYSAPAADAVVIKSSESNSSSVDLTSLDVAGSSFSSEQQRQEVAGLQVTLRPKLLHQSLRHVCQQHRQEVAALHVSEQDALPMGAAWTSEVNSGLHQGRTGPLQRSPFHAASQMHPLCCTPCEALHQLLQQSLRSSLLTSTSLVWMPV